MSKVDIKVSELVDKVKRGELTLPEMQGRYVWTATRVRDLLDSLYRGYPSGTILVWETDDDVISRPVNFVPTNTPITSNKLLLLDGQQRITSLTAVLSGLPVHIRSKKKDKTIDILFNLEHPAGPPTDIMEVEDEEFITDIEDIEDEESAERDIQEELRKRTFVVDSPALRNNPVWVSVSDIFKKTDSQILRAIGINSDDEKWDKYSERLQKVRQIEKYQYVMEVLEKDKSYEEVTEIFVRVNSLGIKLRGSDLAMAQITSRWKGFMEKIESLAKEFGDDENYIIESGLPVRMLVIFATKQSKFKTVGKISKENLEQAWELAMNGLRFAINFVRSNAGIENLKYLSSPFLLLPIAVYATSKKEELSEDECKKILKWFYNAQMRGHYSMGSSESILDSDLSVLFKTNSLDKLLEQLFNHVKKFKVDANDLIYKGIRSPFFSMLYFVLRDNGAKDWLSGLKLSDKHIGRSHTIQYHHIFPKSLLRDAGREQREINEISNLAFIGGKTNRHILNKKPIIYFEKEITAKRGEEALSSQLIPLEKTMWEIDKYPDFIVWRRNAIAEEINKFMKKFD